MAIEIIHGRLLKSADGDEIDTYKTDRAFFPFFFPLQNKINFVIDAVNVGKYGIICIVVV